MDKLNLRDSLDSVNATMKDRSEEEDDDLTRPLLDDAADNIDENRPTQFPSEPLNSTTHALMNFLKANIGTGILAMPVAVKNAGLWVGTIGIMFMGLVSSYCMYLLIISARSLEHKHGKRSKDYADVVRDACDVGPPIIRRHSKILSISVEVFLILVQLGFCCVYVLFIANNVEQIVYCYTSVNYPVQVYLGFLIFLLIPFVYIRHLKHIAPFSTVANVFIAIGVGLILIHVVQDLPPVSKYPAFSSFSTLPLYFGTAVFAYEAISLVLPIERRMEKPEEFTGYFGVLVTAMIITTCLYAAVGFFGYLQYGEQSTVITLNLPINNWLYVMVRIMYCLVLYVSFGLQFYVPANLLYPIFERNVLKGRMQNSGIYIFRTILALMTFLLAGVIPYLELFISLVGSLAGAALAFIYPTIVDTILIYPEFGPYKWRLIKNLLIGIFGVLGFLVGTYVSVAQIGNAIATQGIHLVSNIPPNCTSTG